jgi:hypothetical protein
MFRPYLTQSSSLLLDLARDPSASSFLLEKIAAELHERKNHHSLQALIEVGRLLERAKEREHRERQEQRLAEIERRRKRKEQGFFEWPSTDAPASSNDLSGDQFLCDDGLLRFVGYHVGRNGTPAETRLQILDCVFHNDLPSVESEEYMNQWGNPKTSLRLQKLAESIAAFARNAKRNKRYNFSEAIHDWESDLEYLYAEYYVGRFRFAWPVQRRI